MKNFQVNALTIGTALQFSGGVLLEISKVRKPCCVMDTIDPRLKEDALGRHGMYAKVIKEGVLQAGETVVLKPRSKNKQHQPIVLTKDFQIQGVVVAAIPKI